MNPSAVHTRRAFLAGSAGAVVAAAGCGRAPLVPEEGAGRRPNVVVYLSDTLRADHVGCYGYPLATTPNVDALASEGVVFERCTSPAPWTKPSVATLFSGAAPRVHQTSVTALGRLNHDPSALRVQLLRDSFDTLAERFRAAGYATGYFLTNPHVQSEFGFGQGFDRYLFRDSAPDGLITDDAIAWIESVPEDRPFFIYVHEKDPHAPYRPAAETFEALHGRSAAAFLEELPTPDRRVLEALEVHFSPAPGQERSKRPPLGELTEAGTAQMQRLYAAELREVDADVGRLVEAVRARGAYEDTAFVFTSDHGEEFGEHGGYFHGLTLYDEVLHVPLVMKVPGIGAAQRVPYSVGLGDVYSMLLEIASIGEDEGALIDRAGRVRIEAHQAVVSTLDYYSEDVSLWDDAMYVGSWKVRSFENGKRLSVTNLEEDALEARNLLEEGDSVRARELAEQFREVIAGQRAAALAAGPAEWTTGSEDTREQLEALGYLQGDE